MEIRNLALSVGLAVAALGSIGASGVANAAAMLQITDSVAGNTGGPSVLPILPTATAPGPGSTGSWPNVGALATVGNNDEAIGDPGGTNYGNGPTAGASAGPGMPTDLGGWPNTTPPAGYPPGFAPDPSFNNAYGISGWDASYLNLTQASNVTFQFMGSGDATNHDQFWLYTGGAWAMLWDNTSGTNGTCGMSGPTTPNCPFPGSQYTTFLNAGLVPFLFVNLDTPNPDGTPAIAKNDGTNNPSPDKQNKAGYFLGMDPYLAGGAFDNTGSVAYAGFTDLPGGDHDYEDLVVRMSVPEPGSLFLLGAGLIGFVGVRKRKA